MTSHRKLFQTPHPEEVYTEKDIEKLRERIGSTRYASENMGLGLTEINRICNTLDLSNNIVSESQSVYENIIETDLVNNSSISRIVAGIVYFLCLKNGIPRSLDHVAAASVVENWKADSSWGNPPRGKANTKIGRTFREIATELGEVYTPIDEQEFVKWYCSLLKLDQKIEMKAIDILEKTEEDVQAGVKPSVVAAAAVYFASTLFDDVSLTQKDVSAVSLTNISTISRRYRELMEFFNDREEDYDISAQPYVGDAPWLKPSDKRKLSNIQDGEYRYKRGELREELKHLFEYELIELQDGEPELTELGDEYLNDQLDPNSLIRAKIWPQDQKFIVWMLENEPKSLWEIRSEYPEKVPSPNLYLRRNPTGISPRKLEREGYLEGSFNGYRVSRETKEVLHRNSQRK